MDPIDQFRGSVTSQNGNRTLSSPMGGDVYLKTPILTSHVQAFINSLKETCYVFMDI